MGDKLPTLQMIVGTKKNMPKNVQFEEDTITTKTSNMGMSNFLIKNKLVKNAQQASLLLLCIAAVLLVATLFILMETEKKPVQEYQPDPETVL
jgi:hypothetical protein